ASTLRRLADAGWRDFYDGQLGRTIADFVCTHGGILTREDMAAFVPRITVPCTGAYRNSVIHTAIAPNGGFSLLEALADFESLGETPNDTCVEYWERFANVLQPMWRRRLGPTGVNASPHGTIHVAAAD